MTAENEPAAPANGAGDSQAAAFAAAMDGMAVLDAAGRYLHLNEAHARVYGYDSPADLLGRSWEVLYAPEERRRIREEVLPVVGRDGGWRGEATGLRRDGTAFEQEISLAALAGGGLVCVVRDITGRRRAERLQAALFRIAETSSRVARVEELYPVLHAIVGELMYAGNFYIALDDPAAGTLSFPYWVDEYDPPPAPEPHGRGLTEYVLRSGEPLLADREVFARLIAEGEVEPIGADSVDWLGAPLCAGERVLGVLAVQTYSEDHRYTEADRDVLTFVSRHIASAIERKRTEDEIRRLAFHDALTGLPNRSLFDDRLEIALAQARRGGRRGAVLFLDLDHFKVINDSMGHRVGDRLLARIAERLPACVREGDTVARLGGDEFSFVVTGIDGGTEVVAVAERLLDAVRDPIALDGRELCVTASIGASVFPDDGVDGDTLVRNADTAMYRAKEQGRDGLRLFSPAMNARALERLALETDLRRALARQELLLHYQPLVACSDGRVRGFEALLRWQRDGRCVPPAEFLPVAELTGLIVPIGPWVLRAACSQLRHWHGNGWPGITVGVNLSARQLQQPGLAGVVREVLAETGLAPRFLELELTESHALQNAESTIATLHELRELGVRLALDDFGTGYSSLAYLKRLPVDIVKLDRAFVHDAPLDPDTAAIATAVIDLAHALGLEVVAEGVETEAQRSFLAARGCDLVQGYLLSRPLPAAAVEAFLGSPPPGA